MESSTHIWKTIISLRGVAWVNETSETSPPFIEVPISNPGSEGGHIFVCWGSYILPLSTILLLDLGIVPSVCYCLFFILLL